VEVDLAHAQQSVDDPQCLLEPTDEVVEGIAERSILALVISGAQAEDQPSPADLIESVRHLGQQGRVAEASANDKRPELDACGDRRQSRKYRPCLPHTVRRFTHLAELKEKVVG
jgi:hypothetical protein